jgi:hypothetical protein
MPLTPEEGRRLHVLNLLERRQITTARRPSASSDPIRTALCRLKPEWRHPRPRRSGAPGAAWPGRIGSTQGQSLQEMDLYHDAARRLCTAQGVRGNAWYDCVNHYRQVVFCVLPPNLGDLTEWKACVQQAVADAEQREAGRQRQAEDGPPKMRTCASLEHHARIWVNSTREGSRLSYQDMTCKTKNGRTCAPFPDVGAPGHPVEAVATAAPANT